MDQAPASPAPAPASGALAAALRRYWRQNLRIMLALLLVWALVSLVFSILLADWLNQFRLGGFPLGFWFAQQGSIVVFLVLILVYAILLNALDRKHHREFEQINARESA
jgi:putative solute:sodium symporter small subunit